MSYRLGSGVVGEVPVQGRAAYPEIFGDVLSGVPVDLHPLRGCDIDGVIDLAGPPELSAHFMRVSKWAQQLTFGWRYSMRYRSE
jgi:hypothetical protein